MDTAITLDENALQWCNGNYELVYSCLKHLRKFSKRKGPRSKSRDGSYKLGFFHKFWNKCLPKHLVKDDSSVLKENESDDELTESEDEDFEDLCDPSKDVNLKTNLSTLKTAIVDCMTKSDFHRPRLVPKRRLYVTKEQLTQYVSSRFKDLLENLDKIEDFSKICNVDQFLCCELLYEGLFYYGVNDSQHMPEFTIIENMLFRQTLFQLRSIISLFYFVNNGEYLTDDKFEPDEVFPEAIDILKNLTDRGLVRNLFILLLSTIDETNRFYEYKSGNAPEYHLSISRDPISRDKLDYDLVFKHNSLYLNTLFELLSSYYTVFSPMESDLKYLVSFLPHVFDFTRMFNFPEFGNSLLMLFENYTGDDISAFYPKSPRSVMVWITTRDFDKLTDNKLTWKLCNLLMIMVNTNIKRIDQNLNMSYFDESTLKIFKKDPHPLFYRGSLDQNNLKTETTPDFKVGSNMKAGDPKAEEVEDKLKFERFDSKKLKDLEETRELYSDVELVIDFVLYGVYFKDKEKILEGLSSNVLRIFLKVYEQFLENKEKFDIGYLPVYTKLLKFLFSNLFKQGEGLSKTWYDLINYEIMCKRKLEELSRQVVEDEINAAIFREPGTTLINLLQLFSKIYTERDSEFLFKVYQSIVESYKCLIPDRTSLLFTHNNANYNYDYFIVKSSLTDNKPMDFRGYPNLLPGQVQSQIPFQTLTQNFNPYNKIYYKSQHEHLYKSDNPSSKDMITLNSKDLDHLLLFPNRGFSWHDRNSALLELVSSACNNRNIFVETYPKLMIVLLEFSVFLAGFPKVSDQLVTFLNSGFCTDMQFPYLLQRVVTQLRSLNRGDFDLLYDLIYQQIIARDDRIESAEATLKINTTVPNENMSSVYSPTFEDTTAYLKDYFKSPHNPSSLNPSKYLVGSNTVKYKDDYLKDVENYRIKGLKQEEEDIYKGIKSEHRMYSRRLYTFPLVNTTKEVKKALSNLGLGTSIPFGLVEVSSLIFKLVVTLDPLLSSSDLNLRMQLVKGKSDDLSGENNNNKGKKMMKGVETENRLNVKFGNHTYLDVLFSILSNPYIDGTELLVGSLLRSIASVHVTDHKSCKLSLVKLTQLLQEPSSTLSRTLNYYELSNLMYCLTALTLYLPFQDRYSIYEDYDYLFELIKYTLLMLDTVISNTYKGDKKMFGKRGSLESGTKRSHGQYTLVIDTLSEVTNYPELDYYAMLDNVFNFMLIVSKGPLGLLNKSKATQYLYEQILLPGSSVTYLLVKCATEAKLTTAVSLVCNVFKRDFIVMSLHKISKFNLENKCPNCNSTCGQDQLVHKNVEKRSTKKFTWFLNKIQLLQGNGDVRYQVKSIQKRSGCDVCHNVDFNQRPLSLLMAHEAFLDALSAYSPDLKCDFVGNLSTRDTELRIKTLYILLQFVNRNCSLYLNNKLLTRFKCYLNKATFDLYSTGNFGDSRDREFYYVINDVDMETEDLMLYNKLRRLVHVDFDQISSFSNLRQMNTCTFKAMVTYFFSLNPEIQLKVVDDRLFLNMVKACRQDWEENSWHKVYMLSIILNLVSKTHYSKLLLLTWSSIFEDTNNIKFERNNYNYNVIQYYKLAYMVEIVTTYSSVLNKIHTTNPERDTSFSYGENVKHGLLDNYGSLKDYESLEDYGSNERTMEQDQKENVEILSLLERVDLDYTGLVHNVIDNFCEYETVLYENLVDRIGKFDSKSLKRVWNINSYPIHNNNLVIRLLSQNSPEDDVYEEYSTLVEMYNSYMIAFSFLFEKMLKMYERLEMLKFDVVFDYMEGRERDYEIKFMLQLSVVKRLYANKDFNVVVNVLIQLVNYLLQTDNSHPILKAKIYNVINYFITITSFDSVYKNVKHSPSFENMHNRSGGSFGSMNKFVREGDNMIMRMLISHLSHQSNKNTILKMLFEDSTRNYPVYHDIEVLGHIFTGYKSVKVNNGAEVDYRNGMELDSSQNMNQVDTDMDSENLEEDMKYYRFRCIESLYFSLEKKNPNCTVEALKLLSSLIRGLGTFEANKVEFDTGTLEYGLVGEISVENLKELVTNRLMVNFYLCNECLLNTPCTLCTELLMGTLHVLHSVCTLHQFSSFWFSIKVNEHENLSDMFLKCTFLSVFTNKATTGLLLPTMFILEHLLSTTSIKTRNAIITWLNQYSDLLLSHTSSLLNQDTKLELDDQTQSDNDQDEGTVYICCLLRVYRITFLWLLSDYRALNRYKDNFSLILADVHCKFPLASSLPKLVPSLLTLFSSHLDSSLNWLAVLLCLQTFFPELGAFEMNLNFTSHVPIKTRALELVKLLFQVMLKCSEQFLKFLHYYSTYVNYTTSSFLTSNLDSFNQMNKINGFNNVNGVNDIHPVYTFNGYNHAGELFLGLDERLSGMLTLKIVTLDCCVILLEYILSLVSLPNAVGLNENAPEVSVFNPGTALKLENPEEIRRVIEKLAKVCTANGGSVPSQPRVNSVEFLNPRQLEQVPSFVKQYNYTHRTLFTTLLTSLLNLDSILRLYT
ncbi:hypothetical protein TpMuguga_03g00763 [Theileria parva strain Muguga]|uniref:Uncharacterized protein n=1 Tax=Theileria parva TaxID=5875 RepID=Q4MYS8_THEPA|nr:uncharacterized protein TpMuguga_03g00763 [Theileria parva strain Muguga]EAN30604.1 hypothetical protein TpMuguga_03g00763 [Theileria parva strain Muguga]|eukprot:XP_762887.1 hypothetical protein [Theileria parva strain Muguga]